MAIFHFTAKVISRGKGQSAIAAAAYRSGERLRDEQADEQKFYTSRAERIVFTDIMAPKDAPEWAHDRNALWNNAERAEKRKDAQLAREIEVALPHEMTDQQREYLVKDFAREAFVRKGYAVDIAIHAPDKNSDERNHHAHLMVTMRTLDSDGFAAKKDRSLNSSEQLGEWREQFANLTNRHLERHGIDARVDHRSLKEQGIEREPTVHVGYAGMEIAARGGESDRYQALQDIIARNDIRVEIRALDVEVRALEPQLTRGDDRRAAVHVYPQGTVEPIQRPNAADLPRPDLPGQTQEPDKIRPKRGADSGGMVAQQADAMRTLRRAERHESAPTSPARPAPEAAPPSAGAKPSDGGLMDMVSDATKKLVEEQRRARENEPPTGQPRGGRKR